MLLRRMGAAGVAPSADTFNTLMGACLARGEPAAVPRLFRRLIGLGHAPDALSYTSLISALTRLGRPLDAVRAPCPPRCPFPILSRSHCARLKHAAAACVCSMPGVFAAR